MSRTTRPVIAGLLGLGGLLLTAGPAAAHVSIGEESVPAGGFTSVTLTVPHGCEESPTTSIAIEIPEAILGVTPEVHPGWTVAVETETLAEPVEGSHGEPITERDAVVTYTAEPGHELPDGFRESFVLGFQAPDAAGDTLYFKTIQTCVEGETAWIDEDPESDAPSPSVLVTASEGEGHDDAAEEEDPATEVAAEPIADSADTDSDSSSGLAAAALVVGVLGLVVGGIALSRTRQAS